MASIKLCTKCSAPIVKDSDCPSCSLFVSYRPLASLAALLGLSLTSCIEVEEPRQPVYGVVDRPDRAHKELQKLMIKSNPPGANVLIDNKLMPTKTPGLFNVPKGRVTVVQIRKDCCETYQKEFLIPKDSGREEGYQINAELKEKVVGYLNITVNYKHAVVFINGEKLLGSPPFSKIQVGAKKEIHIKARNPYTAVESENYVTVGKDETKDIHFELKPASKKSNNKRRRR